MISPTKNKAFAIDVFQTSGVSALTFECTARIFRSSGDLPPLCRSDRKRRQTTTDQPDDTIIEEPGMLSQNYPMFFNRH